MINIFSYLKPIKLFKKEKKKLTLTLDNSRKFTFFFLKLRNYIVNWIIMTRKSCKHRRLIYRNLHHWRSNQRLQIVKPNSTTEPQSLSYPKDVRFSGYGYSIHNIIPLLKQNADPNPCPCVHDNYEDAYF